MFLFIMLMFAALAWFIHLNNRLEKRMTEKHNVAVQLFTLCSDGIVILDQERRILAMNPAAERITGWKQSELHEGMTCRELLQCSHQAGLPLSDTVCPLHVGLKTLQNGESVYGEYKICNRDGEWITVSASFFMSGKKNSISPHYFMQVRDITREIKETTESDLVQEFIGASPQTWDEQKIFKSLEAKCKKFFTTDQVILELGTRLYPDSLESDTLERLKPAIQEVHANRNVIEREIEGTGLCILLPLPIGNQVLGVLTLAVTRMLPFTLEDRRKATRLAAQTAAVYKLHTLLQYHNERRIEMEELYNLTMMIRAAQFEEGLNAEVIEAIRKMTRADLAAVLLYDNLQNLRCNCFSGANRLAKDELFDDAIANDLRLGSFSVLHRNDHPQHVLFQTERLLAAAVSPIFYRNTVYGVLLIGMERHKTWDEHETYLIQNISSILAVQILNRHLHRAIENKAILLERERISREIHDGLAQAIGYVNIQMQRIGKMLEQEQFQQAAQEVRAVREVIAESYGEIRDSITNLRLEHTHIDFLDWLKDHAHDFQRTTGLSVELMIDETLADISEEAKIQLIRVIQEALTNIKKHANATRVAIRMKQQAESLRITISDDGRGLSDTQQVKPYSGGQGLKIMKERIQSVNGTFSIHSALNEGTTIEIQLGEGRL